jgi:phospholipid/cholesterol/gamma-HCH transport system substrate-binding protein
MKIFAEHDNRFEGLELKTGLFLLLAALLVAGGILAALVRQGVFTQTTQLHFFANSAQGIGKGMAVQLFGFKIGAVDTLNLEPNGTVKVRLQVQSEYLRLINQDSTARIAKEGLIGASIIEIVPSRTPSRPVSENGVLKFERAADFSSVAEELSAQVRPILADLRQLTESANRPDGDIRIALKNARQLTAEMSEVARQVSKLAGNADRQLSGVLARADQAVAKADATFEKASSTIDGLGDTLTALERKLPELMLKLDRTLANVEAASADARKITASAAEELPPALRDARSLAKDGREIVDGAKRSWPINTLLVEPREQALPLDSFDGTSAQPR